MESCSNHNDYVRIAALAELARRDPQRGHSQAVLALHDLNVWVRFAAAEALTTLVTPDDADVLRKTLKSEIDPATRISLQEALAKAEGKPTPEPPAPARSVLGQHIHTWGGGQDKDGVSSPFSASIQLGIDRSHWKGGHPRTHKDGKALLADMKPEAITNPGLMIVDPNQRDSCLKFIDKSIAESNVANLDGLMLGSRFMRMVPEGLWPRGWRLFCVDAAIDPRKIRGTRANLTVPEQRAWRNWSRERCVDGFNVMYDYVKWRVAKLHPGMQVGTFLPAYNNFELADVRWKFDISAIRDFSGSSRMNIYNTVRHYRTFWPDRPVIYKNFGGVGSRNHAVKRGWKFPDSPIIKRDEHAYATTVTAYLAGADVAWRSRWTVHEPTWKYGDPRYWLGVGLSVDSLFPGSPALNRAVEHAFTGVTAAGEVEKRAALAELKKAPSPELDLTPEEIIERMAARIKAEKAAMTSGFLFYGMYLKDCARVFSGLPRQVLSAAALAVHPRASVSSPRPAEDPLIPAVALLNQYDNLCDLNQIASIDLNRYRFISVHYPGGLLRDRTLTMLTNWLKERPGLLYIHGALETSNESEDSVIGDMDGELKNGWPWEADLDLVPTAKALP